MSLWCDAARPLAEGVDHLLEDKEFRDGVNRVGPQIVGKGVSIVTGHQIAGDVANVATRIVAKQDPDLAARIVLAPIVGLVGALAPIVGTPILLGYGVYRGVKWIAENW